DLPFDVLNWDERVKAHFHLPPDAHVTIETFYARLHPDDREPARRAIESSINNRDPYHRQYRTVDPETKAHSRVQALGRTLYAEPANRADGGTIAAAAQTRPEVPLREENRVAEAPDALQVRWPAEPVVGAVIKVSTDQANRTDGAKFGPFSLNKTDARVDVYPL